MQELPQSFVLPNSFNAVSKNIRRIDDVLDRIVETGLDRVGWDTKERTSQTDAAQIRRSARLMVLLGTFDS